MKRRGRIARLNLVRWRLIAVCGSIIGGAALWVAAMITAIRHHP